MVVSVWVAGEGSLRLGGVVAEVDGKKRRSLGRPLSRHSSQIKIGCTLATTITPGLARNKDQPPRCKIRGKLLQKARSLACDLRFYTVPPPNPILLLLHPTPMVFSAV